jgi:hypothetical protein
MPFRMKPKREPGLISVARTYRVESPSTVRSASLLARVNGFPATIPDLVAGLQR